MIASSHTWSDVIRFLGGEGAEPGTHVSIELLRILQHVQLQPWGSRLLPLFSHGTVFLILISQASQRAVHLFPPFDNLMRVRLTSGSGAATVIEKEAVVPIESGYDTAIQYVSELLGNNIL